MNVRYRVELSQAEREQLTGLLSGGKHAARKLKRAQILLAADAGGSDEEIVRSVGVGGKRRFVLGNLEAALSEQPRPGADRKLSSKEEALLVATACSNPPKGRARYTDRQDRVGGVAPAATKVVPATAFFPAVLLFGRSRSSVPACDPRVHAAQRRSRPP